MIGGRPEMLVIEAKLKLGAMLTMIGAQEEAARVRAVLSGIPREIVHRCERDLLDAPRSFHEVTDRQVDLRWLHADERAPVAAFAASLGA